MILQQRLVAVVQGVGILHARGSYTGAMYEIPPQGTLVHPYDVESILAQQRTFCCRGGEPAQVIYPFFEGKPTAGQVGYVEVPDPGESPKPASTLPQYHYHSSRKATKAPSEEVERAKPEAVEDITEQALAPEEEASAEGDNLSI